MNSKIFKQQDKILLNKDYYLGSRQKLRENVTIFKVKMGRSLKSTTVIPILPKISAIYIYHHKIKLKINIDF